MNNQLKSKIMRRVYAIWFVRRIAPPAISLGFFGYLAIRETAQSFFVAKIISNFLTVATNVWAIPGFVGSALNHAEPQILFVVAFSILATFVLAVKLLQNIRVIMMRRNQMLFSNVLFK